MTRILLAVAAFAAILVGTTEIAQAQHRFRGNGFNRGGGIGAGVGGFNFGYYYQPNTYNSFHRPDNVPYFMKHPPVYYSRTIVKRPYGISPYAAPAGVAPVEFQILDQAPEPVRIVNPHAQSPSFEPVQPHSHQQHAPMFENAPMFPSQPPEPNLQDPSMTDPSMQPPSEAPNEGVDPDSIIEPPAEEGIDKAEDGDWNMGSGKKKEA